MDGSIDDHYLPLHKACLQKDVKKLSRLLYLRSGNLDVNETDHQRRTPLILAAKNGCVSIVFQLLDHGVILDKKDILGNTALIYASSKDFHQIVLHLLARGADPNLTDGTGATPLIVASKHGHENVVRLLLAQDNAWVDHADRHGASALWYAAYYGNERVVDMLLCKKAKPNIVDIRRKTPLIAAAQQGYTECAYFIVNDPRTLLDAQDYEGKTALRYAGETNNLQLVQALIRKGANPNARTIIDKTTVLMAASELGHASIVSTMLNHPDIIVDMTDYADRTALYYACKFPHIVKNLIEKGANVNHVDRAGKTPLMVASQIGQLDTLLQVLQTKNINRIDHDGHTALAYAAMGNFSHIVSSLIKAGADASIADEEDNTPLMMAVKHRSHDVLDVLLGQNTLDFRDYQGRTALAHACIRGFPEIVKKLLRHKAHLVKDHQDTTPLMLACIHNHPLVVHLLVQKPQDLDSTDKTGHTALYYAAREEALDCIHILLEKQASGEKANKSGITPLIVAAISGNLEIVEALAPISNIDHADDMGRTALYHACEGGHSDVVSLLIEKNASTTKACFYGKTPLMLAASLDNDEMIQKILDTQARYLINDSDVDGCTALHYAAEQGFSNIAEILMQHEADILAKDEDGNTPCLAAAERGYFEVVKITLTHSPNLLGKTPLHQASVFGHRLVVDFLIKNGANVDETDHHGNTPLILACMRKHHDVVQLLLQYKSATTINVANQSGKTALFYAIFHHLFPIVKLLHQHGADAHILENNGTLWATGYPQYLSQTMIQVLIDDFGIHVNAKNHDGKTALFCLALAFGNKSGAIEFLLSRGADPWIPGPSGVLPIAGAANARVHKLLKNAMTEHERFFALEKARHLSQITKPLRENVPKRPRPSPRISWNSSDKKLSNVMDHVIRGMNDDLFRELWGYMKCPWE